MGVTRKSSGSSGRTHMKPMIKHRGWKRGSWTGASEQFGEAKEWQIGMKEDI